MRRAEKQAKVPKLERSSAARSVETFVRSPQDVVGRELARPAKSDNYTLVSANQLNRAWSVTHDDPSAVVETAIVRQQISEPGMRKIRGACPLDCPDACCWIVSLSRGQPVRLRGDPSHPYTGGWLCNKVAGYLDYARSPDRALCPMCCVGPTGRGEFTRISWHEALETIGPRRQGVLS